LRTQPLPTRTPTHASSRYTALGARPSLTVVAVGALLVAVAAGFVIPRLPTTPVAPWLLAAPALVVILYVMLLGPKWCLAGIIATTVVGLNSESISAGGVDLRVSDLFYVALVVWVVVLRTRDGQRGYLIGRRALGLWLVTAGFSLYPLLVHGTVQPDVLVAWLRLVVTFSILWFVPYAVRSLADMEFTLGALGLVASAEVGGAALIGISRGDFAGRLSGTNGPNTTGLLAAMILVLAIHGPVPRRPYLRYSMLVIGAVGLMMTRSLGATAAAVVALGFYGLRGIYRRYGESRSQLITPSRVLIMLLVGLAAATLLRPTNLPGASRFGYSTTAHRLVLADAGLRVFLDHPVTGVGWQRGPFEIGRSQIAAQLQDDWGNSVNPDFIPRGVHTTSVHNSYIQILTESGLLGLVFFLAAFVALAVGMIRVLRTVRSNRPLYLCVRAALVLIVVILIWLNDNPLFGAQPETVLLATFLGMFASAPGIARAMRSSSSGAEVTAVTS
jgi:O-antigen ligase